MSVRYLLATNAASYLINKKSAAMDRRLSKVAVDELGISAVTEGELHYGVARKGSTPLRTALEQFLLTITTVAWDSAAAREYGRLRTELERQGQLPGGLDLMSAAQAVALGVILVTGDRAFGRIKNLKTEDWTK
jgi:tRNA(fMet)-specific endonuclease VapC